MTYVAWSVCCQVSTNCGWQVQGPLIFLLGFVVFCFVNFLSQTWAGQSFKQRMLLKGGLIFGSHSKRELSCLKRGIQPLYSSLACFVVKKHGIEATNISCLHLFASDFVCTAPPASSQWLFYVIDELLNVWLKDIILEVCRWNCGDDIWILDGVTLFGFAVTEFCRSMNHFFRISSNRLIQICIETSPL